jgi:hypothetical protein
MEFVMSENSTNHPPESQQVSEENTPGPAYDGKSVRPIQHRETIPRYVRDEWILCHPALSWREKAIAILILSMAKEHCEGCCSWPGMGTLSKKLGIDKAHISRAVTQLERCGVFERIMGLRTSTTYRFPAFLPGYPKEGGVAKTATPKEGGVAKTATPKEGGVAKTATPKEGGVAKTATPKEGGVAKTATPKEGGLPKQQPPLNGSKGLPKQQRGVAKTATGGLPKQQPNILVEYTREEDKKVDMSGVIEIAPDHRTANPPQTTRDVCSQDELFLDEPPGTPEVFERAPLIGGGVYEITVAQVTRFTQLYPATDVEQEIRRAVAWSEANPKKRKTKNGYLRHLNAWLAGAQDNPRNTTARGNGNGRHETSAERYHREMDAAFARARAKAGIQPSSDDNVIEGRFAREG